MFDAMGRQEGGRFSEAEARRLFLQVLSSVRHLHRHGIAHRDISLENVLLSSSSSSSSVNGDAKLCDFGLAGSGTRGRCLFSRSAGKPYYCAPEMRRATAARPYCGLKADRWSLGVFLFLLLTGFPPFDMASCDKDTTGGFNAIASGRLPEVIAKWCAKRQQGEDALSEASIDLMTRMLKVNPEERPSLEEVAAHPWFAMEEAPTCHNPQPRRMVSSVSSISLASTEATTGCVSPQKEDNDFASNIIVVAKPTTEMEVEEAEGRSSHVVAPAASYSVAADACSSCSSLDLEF